MLTHSLALLLRKAALRARVQRRREQEGDDIDLDEWLLAIDSPLRGSSPGHASGDPERVYRRMSRKPVRCAMLLLVDCSASSARPYGPDAALSQLAAQQRAASLLAQAACAAGWSVAIQGFSSDGRHRVEHWHVKDFAEPWDSSAAQSLANLGCGGSTRLGAAVRHASTALSREAADCRLLLALGDGEPHDVDIHDPRYLVEDARHAVQMARMQGIDCSALLFDAAMANIPEQVFGKNAALPLRALEGLPSALGRLLARRR
ncbi:von Willebrand factor type A domain (fragment) [Burkholderiales bacterium 8X]